MFNIDVDKKRLMKNNVTKQYPIQPNTSTIHMNTTTTTAYVQWLQRLQLFLDKLLTVLFPVKATRDKYLTPMMMVIWGIAFTHETVSPSDNYEDLEYLGDAMLKAVFPKYLMRKLPELHKGEYTELNVYYMSKIRQAELSRRLGFGEYIRVQGIDRAILNLETDVFESFFGALDTISDMLVHGLGFANCYKMIEYIFKDIVIDPANGRGSAKTQVIQMFVRFDLPKPQEYADETDKYHTTFTVSLPRENLEFLHSYTVDIDDPIIGYGQGATKKEAEYEAYTQALNLLASYGITTEWAEEAKQARDFMEPSVARYVPAAAQRLEREGFDKMYFFIPRKTVTPKGAIVQLVGIRPTGKHEVLSYTYATERENSYQAAKTLVVQQYASGR